MMIIEIKLSAREENTKADRFEKAFIIFLLSLFTLIVLMGIVIGVLGVVSALS